MSTGIVTVSDQVKSSFNFEIAKLPLSGPDNMKTPMYGLFRDDNGEFVGMPVSDRYVPHTTDDVVALVEAAQSVFEDDVMVKTYFNDGHYVFVEPSKDHRRAIFGSNDNIFPRVIIRAGYDGKAFSATMGYYRDACKNLAIMRQVSGTNVSIRHTKGLRPKMNELIDTFGYLRDGWKTLGDVIAELQNRPVIMTNFLDAIYGQPDPESKRGMTVHKNRTEEIFRRLQHERFITERPSIPDTFEVSAWEAYNAIQGYSQHEQTRHGQTTAIQRIVMASKDPSVLKAEGLVLSMLTA